MHLIFFIYILMTIQNISAQHAVIVGSGPSGLLTAIGLIKSGWTVTLIDKFPSVPKTQKSWMIGISAVGKSALEKYGVWDLVEKEVIHSEHMHLFTPFGKCVVKIGADTIDRNAIVATLLDYLLKLKSENLKIWFRTKVLNIDSKKRVLVELDDEFHWINYDLLVGADGARSVVRNSLFTQLPMFQQTQANTFSIFKVILIDVDQKLIPTQGRVYAGIFTGAMVFVIPAGDGKMNFIYSVNENAAVDDAMLNGSPEEVCEYLNERLAPLQLDIDSCRRLVDTTWSTTKEVKCYPYHAPSLRGSAVLIGDAAHATHPQLGMGMNTGLQDAVILVDLLNNYELDEALELYTKERAKIGYALTELSHHDHAHDGMTELYCIAGKSCRRLLNSYIGYFDPIATEQCTHGVPLDKVYEKALQQGFDYVRNANLKVEKEWMECMLGLRPHTKESAVAAKQRDQMIQQDFIKLTLEK